MTDTVNLSENTLLYGDNMDWLPRIPGESIDLIYLDPPFNSNRNYNVLFKDEKGSDSQAQMMAFEDTWHWGPAAEDTYFHLIREAPANVSSMVSALREFIGSNQMMAYLVMMTQRLLELHRVLKPTGSLYLHCDPTASHYLKIVLDTVFGPENFRNEIIWKRTSAKGLAFTRFATNHDTLLCYSKSERATWNPQYSAHDPKYIEEFYRYTEPETGRRYRLDNLANPNKDRPNLTYEFPPGSGTIRVWRWTKERMMQAWAEGRVVLPEKGKVVAYKRYLDEQEGTPVGDIWTDILPVQSQSKELLGYPTQKPLTLLERIIEASSNPGDMVLDPFCGCGTAIAAAQKLERRWAGIDITHLSIALMKYRLEAMFPGITFKVDGEPKDVGAARKLALDDRYQFQFWACSLVRAKPLGGEVGSRSGKKGSDKGIDGVIDFIDDPSGKRKQILVQVKSGHVKSGDIRDLLGTIGREKAEMGIYITLEKPTRDMLDEAVKAGYYESHWGRHPRIQIFTIEELIDRSHPRKVDMPPQEQVSVTFKRPGKAERQSAAAQLSLLDAAPAGEPVPVAALPGEEDEEVDEDWGG